MLDGTAAIRVYNGADQSNGNVRYQYSMGDVARECSKSGNQIVIRVGVEGRVLLGLTGAPGNFSIPVRIAMRRESDQKPAAAKLYQVAATVPPGQTEAQFTFVSEPLTVPCCKPTPTRITRFSSVSTSTGQPPPRKGRPTRKSGTRG